MLSKTSDRLVMVRNAVDNFRHKAHMAPGEDRMDESGDFAPKAEETQTVLLSDVINKAVEVEQPKNIIVKIDIESYECRAFMGSPDGNTISFISKRFLYYSSCSFDHEPANHCHIHGVDFFERRANMPNV